MQTYRYLFQKITRQVKAHQKQKDYKKFKKIDTHEHLGKNPDFNGFGKITDEFRIEKVFLMPTGKNHREKFKQALKIQNQSPDKITAFTYLDGVGLKAEAELKQTINSGAKGLKLLLWHPNLYPNLKIELDSEPVFRILAICQRYNLPVNAHISLRNFPDHKEKLKKLLTKFPRLTFIAPHYAGAAPQLEITAELLNEFPNLYTDVSMGGGKNRYVAYIQGFRTTFRRFFKDYYQRLFWGTDVFIGSGSAKRMNFYRQRIRHDINLFDERFFYSPFWEENRFLHGLNLADKILEDVFYNNAKQVFGQLI